MLPLWGWNKLFDLGYQKLEHIPIWLMTALKNGLGNPIWWADTASKRSWFLEGIYFDSLLKYSCYRGHRPKEMMLGWDNAKGFKILHSPDYCWFQNRTSGLEIKALSAIILFTHLFFFKFLMSEHTSCRGQSSDVVTWYL